MIRRRKVYKIRIDYVCSKCEKGKMIYQCESTGDKKFFHECDMCKYEMYLDSVYPHYEEETDLWGV